MALLRLGVRAVGKAAGWMLQLNRKDRAMTDREMILYAALDCLVQKLDAVEKPINKQLWTTTDSTSEDE